MAEDSKERKCMKKNELGECIEWQEVGDNIVPVFKESEKKCNPELFEKWKKFSRERKIAILPED